MMKKLKVLLLTMVLAMGVAFYVPTVQASEPTTEEPITEELQEDDLFNDIGDWLTAIGLGFLSSSTFAVIGGVILNSLKKKAFNEVAKAVTNNEISQATADKATQFIQDSYVELQNKFDDVVAKFEELKNQAIENNEKMAELIERYQVKDEQLAELVEEYLGDEEND